jgi:hypothetical protein
MNESHPQRLAQDHYQWRLYTVAAAGASFFAGMLVNNWIERRIRQGPPRPQPRDMGTER